MKKIFTLFLVVSLTLALFACTAKNPSLDNSSSESSSSENSSVIESSIPVSEESSASQSSSGDPSSSPSTVKPSVSHSSSSTPSSNNQSSTVENSDPVPNTDAQERAAFQNLYALEKSKYLANIQSQINTLSTELNSWKSQRSSYDSQYTREINYLRERYASMGMLDSGAYQQALSNLKSNYNSQTATCNQKIQQLENEIATLTAEYNNPQPVKILLQIGSTYNMSAEEVVGKYTKYILNS